MAVNPRELGITGTESPWANNMYAERKPKVPSSVESLPEPTIGRSPLVRGQVLPTEAQSPLVNGGVVPEPVKVTMGQ